MDLSGCIYAPGDLAGRNCSSHVTCFVGKGCLFAVPAAGDDWTPSTLAAGSRSCKKISGLGCKSTVLGADGGGGAGGTGRWTYIDFTDGGCKSKADVCSGFIPKSFNGGSCCSSIDLVGGSGLFNNASADGRCCAFSTRLVIGSVGGGNCPTSTILASGGSSSMTCVGGGC